jgi:hypothetical protein
MQGASNGQLIEVACDESGSEGEKLIGGETDVFAHASVQLSIDAARSCILEIHDRIRSPVTEYKATHLLRKKHRLVLEWLLGSTGPIHDHAHVHLIDKTFFTVGKVIDLLYTSESQADAFKLHREGQHILGREQWEAFLGSFNDLIRPNNRRGVTTTVDSFFTTVNDIRLTTSDGRLHEMLARLWQARPQVDSFRSQLLSNPTEIPGLDPLFPALVQTVQYWSASGLPVTIVHDEQITLTVERIAQLKEIFNGRLSSLRLVDSREDPRVQVADFLAGVARKIASEELNNRGDPILTTLLRPYINPASTWGDSRSWALLNPSQA